VKHATATMSLANTRLKIKCLGRMWVISMLHTLINMSMSLLKQLFKTKLSLTKSQHYTEHTVILFFWDIHSVASQKMRICSVTTAKTLKLTEGMFTWL